MIEFRQDWANLQRASARTTPAKNRITLAKDSASDGIGQPAAREVHPGQ
jgi:hypothetical protein